jgi:FdrA protein
LPVKTLINRSEYHDSVTLMLVARELSHFPGLRDAAVVMGTEANKGLLRDARLLSPDAEAATPNDLLIAVSGQEGSLEDALARAEELLGQKQSSISTTEYRPKTLRSAARANPAANVAVISVAGRYAAAEAWDALHLGLHVLLFSDNVSLEDEIALKRYAVKHGLLMMGPGAGTAILNQVALGFANVLPPGPVGIVSAAGTGLQEVSTLLARQGVGITQGIGTGGRDLKEEVGGLMMLAGLKALQKDPATQVIVLISKPPAPTVARKVIDKVWTSQKPTIVCFLGEEQQTLRVSETLRVFVQSARTLENAAWLAAEVVRSSGFPGSPGTGTIPIRQPPASSDQVIEELRARFHPDQRYLRGLFSGGTLCYEAQVIWRDWLPEPVFSNAPLEDANRLPDSLHSQRHTAVDLGEEEFTVGRPHPMIDNDLRIRRLLQEARDPEVGVIVLDVVLGYGAHPDPSAELGPAIRQARQEAQVVGRELIVVASVTGTEGDPQGFGRQVAGLEAFGAVVCESNAAAARLAAKLVNSGLH